ncbi:MAG: T9SS type A sorting domain-containing protein, partial [Ignavibacteria bacterium]|nr:T9SS type A sorting domain-containing protein [Ignavibacteria bacterium]
ILKTTDGGLNWFSQLNHLLATFFNSVNFKDSLNGWAVGTKSFQTTDGGESWVQKNEFDNQLIWDIYFLNDSTGWILGDSLSRTDDGGNTWYKVPNTPVSSGEFEWVDDEVGYITGGAFYKTTNGGNAWQHIPYESGKAFTRFSAPLKGFGFGVNGIGLIMKFDDRVTSIREESISFPETNILYQNYPNPFNTSTVIKYYLKNSGYVKLGIYNILGKEIIVLQDSYLNSGEYSARWDGKINYEFVASGVYIYRLVINNRKEVVTLNKKLLIIK